MSATPKLLRIIDIVAVAIVLAAAAIALWPVRVNVAPAQLQAAANPLPANATTSDTSSDAAIVVSANILSGSRRAPAVRYVSPENISVAAYEPPPAFATGSNTSTAHADSGTGDNSDAVPAVYGIVNTDGAWRALVRLSPADVIPVLLREGDKRGTFRIVSISADRVVIAGAAGQRTLRLSRRPPGDSTAYQP